MSTPVPVHGHNAEQSLQRNSESSTRLRVSVDNVSVGRTSGFDEMCSTYALNSRFRVASRQGTLRPQRGGVMTLRVMIVRTVDRPIAPRDSGGQPDQPSVGVSSPPRLRPPSDRDEHPDTRRKQNRVNFRVSISPVRVWTRRTMSRSPCKLLESRDEDSGKSWLLVPCVTLSEEVPRTIQRTTVCFSWRTV